MLLTCWKQLIILNWCLILKLFHGTLVEALSARLPVIAINVDGNSDLLHQGTNVFLVPVSDSDGFEKRVKKMAVDPILIQAMSRKSREVAMYMFAIDPFLRDHLRLYSCDGA